MDTSIATRIFRSAVSVGLITATVAFVILFMRPAEVVHRARPQANINTVEVVPIQEHVDGIDFQVDGQVIPYRTINIAPEVSGIVKFKSENARSGRYVRAGELLLEIDPVDYQLEVRRSTEAVAQSQQSCAEMEVQIENTNSEIKLSQEQLGIRQREQQRYESVSTPGVYSASELDTVHQSVLSAKESLTRLENQLRLYQRQLIRFQSTLEQEKVNLDVAKLNLKRTKITAPIDGVVTSHSFEVNSYLQKGTVIACIQDTSRLEIQCYLQMKQMSWVWQSAPKTDDRKINYQKGYEIPPVPATVYYELEGQRWSWSGNLTTSDTGGLDSKTRMIVCRVTIDDPTDVKFDSVVEHKVDTSLGIADSPAQCTSVTNITTAGATTAGTPKPHEAPLLQDSPPTLLNGMYVTVIVHTKPDIPLYKIPEKALLPGNRIWTATGGVLQRHDIRVATTTSGVVLFYADSHKLSTKDTKDRNQDQVVVSPLAAPAEGEKVHLL